MIIRSTIFSVLVMFSTQVLGASAFVGYELGQMAFNGFRHFAGEVGYELDNKSSIRFAFLNVALSERHLSSDEASAVKGDNVEGLWRGAEFLYDIPVTQHVFVSPSAGYYDTTYSHTILNQSVSSKSTTGGIVLSYRDTGIFGFNEFYWRFSIAYRHYFNPVKKTDLGDSKVSGDNSEFTPAIFVGYVFN